MKIYIKTENPDFFPEVTKSGDWIDLANSADVELNAPYVNDDGKVVYDFKQISLGIGMILPDGFEAHVLPRSSLFKKKGCILVNSMGMIDNPFNGEEDIWQFTALAFRKTNILKGEKIAQFRIELSQKATFWQKLKWLLSSRIELIPVNRLKEKSRGGIGSTGGMVYGK